MKQRIGYLARLFAVYFLFFILQKAIFIAANAGASAVPVSVADAMRVFWHGAPLDAATCGYLTALPFLCAWLGLWIRRLNPRSVLRPYFILVALLLSAVCMADTALYSFWKFKLDATVLNYIDAPKQVLASVSAGFVALRIAVVTVFCIMLSRLCLRITPDRFLPFPDTVRRKVAWNLCHILLGGVLFLCIRGGVGRSTMNVGKAYFSENTFLNHAAVNPAFNLIYSWRKTENFAAKYNYLDDDTRARIYAPLYPDNTDDCTRQLLTTSRPSVLIIILEGFGGSYIEALGGAKDVAPNLERLIREGVFFDNVYANSFRTDRGLVSTLSGHVSYPTTSVMKMPTLSGRLPGIARTLQAAGYKTDFLYGGDIDFTNMRSYFIATGYRHLTTDEDFSLAERTSSSWGTHDEYTFRRLFDMIKSRPADELWHTGFLTLSSHEPFEVPYHRLADSRNNSFAYTDHCLGEFVDRLKTLPVWQNLLVVCIPDHGSAAEFTPSLPEFYHIPMLWLGGAVKEPCVVHTLMNQSDMAATLLAQLGLPHQDFKYSRNVFSSRYTYPFAYSTFSDGFMFKDSTGVTIFDNAARRTVYSSSDTDAGRLEKGQSILQSSYKELGGE